MDWNGLVGVLFIVAGLVGYFSTVGVSSPKPGLFLFVSGVTLTALDTPYLNAVSGIVLVLIGLVYCTTAFEHEFDSVSPLPGVLLIMGGVAAMAWNAKVIVGILLVYLACSFFYWLLFVRLNVTLHTND